MHCGPEDIQYTANHSGHEASRTTTVTQCDRTRCLAASTQNCQTKKKKSHIKNKNKTPLEACRYQLMLMIINRTQFCLETLQLIPSDLTKGFCREMKHAKSNDSIHSPELLCTTFTLFSKYSECAPANYQLHNSQFSNPVHLTRLCYIILHVWQLIPRRNFSLNLQ